MSDSTDDSATDGTDDTVVGAVEETVVVGAPPPQRAAVRQPRQVSVPLRTLLTGAAIVALTVAVAVLGWLYRDAHTQLAAAQRQAAADEHAQQIALDYATAAAQMDFRDLAAWKTRLVAGTSPELRVRLADAAESMEQILAPLQWESAAKPLAAVVRSHTGSSYIVDSFVSVLTKTTQAPDGLQSTATYSVTIDSDQDWQITDVGGIDAVLGAR